MEWEIGEKIQPQMSGINADDEEGWKMEEEGGGGEIFDPSESL